MPDYPFLIFQIDELLFAIPVNAIEQTLRAAELTDVPVKPELLQGLLNVKGDILPVVNIRKQLRRPERPLRISDRFIVARVESHRVAFAADRLHAVAELVLAPVDSAELIYPDLEQYLTAASRYDRQTVLVYDIECLIPPQQADAIHQFLQQAEIS